MATEFHRLLDAKDAAVALGVTPATIRQWVKRGKLKRTGTGANQCALYAIEDLLAVQDARNTTAA